MAVYDVLIIGGGPTGLSAAITTTKEGLKTLVIKPNKHDELLDKELVLIGDKAYGLIRLTSIEEINVTKFQELRPAHCISETEREDRDTIWRTGPLCAYSFEFKPFENPLDYEKAEDNDSFIFNVMVKSGHLGLALFI